MRPALLLPVVLLVACSQSSTPHPGTAAAPAPSPPTARPAAPATSAPGPQAVRITAEQTACVEKWLAGHGLDDVGNPKGTMYAGGTPTFDEKTGASVDRWAVVAKNRPEALQFCQVPLGR